MLGTPGEKFANSVSEILGCIVEVIKPNEMHVLRLFLKDGLWKSRFLDWMNAKKFEYRFTNDGTSFFCMVGKKDFKQVLNKKTRFSRCSFACLKP